MSVELQLLSDVLKDPPKYGTVNRENQYEIAKYFNNLSDVYLIPLNYLNPVLHKILKVLDQAGYVYPKYKEITTTYNRNSSYKLLHEYEKCSQTAFSKYAPYIEKQHYAEIIAYFPEMYHKYLNYKVPKKIITFCEDNLLLLKKSEIIFTLDVPMNFLIPSYINYITSGFLIYTVLASRDELHVLKSFEENGLAYHENDYWWICLPHDSVVKYRENSFKKIFSSAKIDMLSYINDVVIFEHLLDQ